MDVASRCGFCASTFSTWAARAEHLAGHFKCRVSMDDWVGDWGFTPEILGLVEKADISHISPSLSSVPELVTTMPPPSLPMTGKLGVSGGPVSIVGGEFLHPSQIQQHQVQMPLFSQQEMDDAAIALAASLHGGEALLMPVDMGLMGFDGGGGLGVGDVDVDGGGVMQGRNFGAPGLDVNLLLGTDIVDWAQFTA